MGRIADVVQQVAPGAKANYKAAFGQAEPLFERFGITTPLRVTHFLAQVLHETGGGKVLFENLNYTTSAQLMKIFGIGRHSAAIRPEEVAGLLRNAEALAERVYGLGNPPKARELGNERLGDGFRFRGGGCLQTTGGANYRRMGNKVGVDFFREPESIVLPEHALKPALHEWDEGNLNASADKGDIRTITRRINGGFNGLADRQGWVDRLWPIVSGGAAPAAWEAASPDPDTSWLQQALNDLGARPPLAVDGRYGPKTTQAVEAFQKLAKVGVDGVAGDVTRAAIRLRLAAIRGN